MLPVIDKKKTGINLHLIMDERGLTVKDVQQYLKLGSVQSVYHWLNGISLPTVDNLYAVSYLFQVPSFDDAEEELKRMEEFRKAQAGIEKKNDAKAVSQKMFKVV